MKLIALKNNEIDFLSGGDSNDCTCIYDSGSYRHSYAKKINCVVNTESECRKICCNGYKEYSKEYKSFIYKDVFVGCWVVDDKVVREKINYGRSYD